MDHMDQIQMAINAIGEKDAQAADAAAPLQASGGRGS
jgi:hypothetical protein